MIDHNSMKMAIRGYAKTLVVASTGVMSLSATATGYARVAGSFATDGFAPGMEIVPAGFVNTVPKIITKVTDLSVDVLGGAPVEAAAGGRSLVAGLPLTRKWANAPFKAVPGQTYFEEQYVPGPTKLMTVGQHGEIELTPMYAGIFYVPENTGDKAANKYADAFTTLFAPGTPIVLPNGDVLRVRSDVGPYPGQLLPIEGGFSAMTVTVPFWLRTTNSR